MFDSARKRLRSVAVLAVAGALVVGGVAVAQSGSGGESKGGPGKAGKAMRGPGGPHGGPPPGPPGLGKQMRNLTYAELHVKTKEGGSRVIRVDQGTVAAVSSDSITVTENDGNEVTIAVDEETKVLGKPGTKASLDDIEEGQRVLVSGPSGGTAKTIALLPKKGEGPGKPGARKGGPQGPPQSGRAG